MAFPDRHRSLCTFILLLGTSKPGPKHFANCHVGGYRDSLPLVPGPKHFGNRHAGVKETACLLFLATHKVNGLPEPPKYVES